MQFTTYEIEVAKSAFRKKKRQVNVMTVPLQICIISFVGIRLFMKEQFTSFIETNSFYGIGLDVIFFGITALMLILAIVSTFIWRCPYCGRRFGRARSFKHCMHCGIELEDE